MSPSAASHLFQSCLFSEPRAGPVAFLCRLFFCLLPLHDNHNTKSKHLLSPYYMPSTVLSILFALFPSFTDHQYNEKNPGFRAKQTRVQIPITSCVAMDKPLLSLEPQFPHLHNGYE